MHDGLCASNENKRMPPGEGYAQNGGASKPLKLVLLPQSAKCKPHSGECCASTGGPHWNSASKRTKHGDRRATVYGNGSRNCHW